MSRDFPRLARCALLGALLAPAAALAGQSATLTVTVRVVDRCTLEVPPAQPPGLAWLGGGPHPAAHACAGGTPAIIHVPPHTPVAGTNGPPGHAGGGPPGKAGKGPPGKAGGPNVLVTVTY